MKNHYLLVLLVICACSKNPEQVKSLQPDKFEASLNTSDDADLTLADVHNFEGDQDLTEDNECARGIPRPILDSTEYPERLFELNDRMEGIEKFSFQNGEKLIITHSGCEYIITSFEFSTNAFQKDTTDLKYWSHASAEILDDLKTSTSTGGFDLEKGLDALESYYSQPPSGKSLNDEIEFGGEDIRSFVSLDRIQQIDEKEYKITLTFGVGPL